MGKVNVRRQRRLDLFMPGKLFAVVCGDGQSLVQIRPQQGYGGICHDFGVFAGHFLDQGKLGNPVNYCHQCALVVFADDGVNFPIAQAGLLADYQWAVVNTDPVPDLPTLVLGPVLPALLAAVPKVLVQRSSIELVSPNVLIDPLMADIAMPSSSFSQPETCSGLQLM